MTRITLGLPPATWGAPGGVERLSLTHRDHRWPSRDAERLRLGG